MHSCHHHFTTMVQCSEIHHGGSLVSPNIHCTLSIHRPSPYDCPTSCSRIHNLLHPWMNILCKTLHWSLLLLTALLNKQTQGLIGFTYLLKHLYLPTESAPRDNSEEQGEVLSVDFCFWIFSLFIFFWCWVIFLGNKTRSGFV